MPAKKPQITLYNPYWADNLLDRPERYIIVRGGRGSGKTYPVVCNIILKCLTTPGYRVLIVRRTKVSSQDGILELIRNICDQWHLPGIRKPETSLYIRFPTTKAYITAVGAQDAGSMQGLELFDLAVIEEAQFIDGKPLRNLRPSIRKPGSKQIYIYNPTNEDDYVHTLTTTNIQRNSYITPVLTYEDNRFFSDELENDRLSDLENDDPDYEHRWLGELATSVGGLFFTNKLNHESLIPGEPYMSVRSWDIAYGTTPDSNYTVGFLMSVFNGQVYCSDMYRGQWSPDTSLQMILEAAENDGKDVPIRIEQQIGGANILLQNQWNPYLKGYRVTWVPTGGRSKYMRAVPLSVVANHGKLHFDQKYRPVISEMSKFTAEKQTPSPDCVDSLSLGHEFLQPHLERSIEHYLESLKQQ